MTNNVSGPKINGTLWNLGPSGFWDVDQVYRFSDDDWKTEFDHLEAIGTNIVVLFAGIIHCLSKIEMSSASGDILELIYKEADARGFEVYIAAGGDRTWWDHWDLNKTLSHDTPIIDRIHQRYGSHQSFAGWYLDYEIYLRWGTEAESMRSLYRELVEICKERTPELPVMVSPFFMPDTADRCMVFQYGPPQEYLEYWTDLLSYSKVDILALQNNGGQHLSCFEERDTSPFIKAFVAACQAAGTRFWGNVEWGELEVSDLDSYVERFGAGADVNQERMMPYWRGVPTERLKKNLTLMAQYTDTIVTWGYCEFVRPVRNVKPALYQQYTNSIRVDDNVSPVSAAIDSR